MQTKSIRSGVLLYHLVSEKKTIKANFVKKATKFFGCCKNGSNYFIETHTVCTNKTHTHFPVKLWAYNRRKSNCSGFCEN